MAVNRREYQFSCLSNGCKAIVDTLRSAFIDAGVMTEWFDSWELSSGTYYGSFRVLKLVQDAGKAYGTVYVIFQANYGNYYASWRQGLSIAFATGWNATSHTPVGTQFLDYYNTPPGWWWGLHDSGGSTLFLSTSSAYWINQKLVTYQSGNTLAFQFPGLSGVYVIQTSIDTQPSWLDLNKVCLPPVFTFGGSVGSCGSNHRTLWCGWPFQIKRMVFPGRSVRTDNSIYFSNRLITTSFTYAGYHGTVDENDASVGNYYFGAIRLPWSDGANLAGSTQAWSPIMRGINMAPPLNMKLPSDFGIATIPSTSRSGSIGSRLKVSESEVWEVIGLVSTSGQPNSMVIVARMV